MTFAELSRLLNLQPHGVILLEGRRTISPEDASLAMGTASFLAERFPRARFRSGNATGSDEAFSEGIARVDPSRLQVVAPYHGHRMKFRYDGAQYSSPEEMSILQDEEVAYRTIQATPKNRRLIEGRSGAGPLAAKARYLIRDTMKVTGHSTEFPAPVCALFYVHLDDPMDGGTGHTIRVCEQEGIPYFFQDIWRTWVEEAK
jgi:hypothetical protein